MRGQVGLWGVPLVLGVGTAVLGGGCGLVLNYGDLGGTGGAAGASASSGSTSSSAASGPGGGSTTASSGSGETSTSTGASMSSSSGGGSCAGTCLPSFPGWTPVSFYEDNGPLPSCAQTPLQTGGTDPAGAEPSCMGCTCGTPTCASPFRVDVWTLDPTCAPPADTFATLLPTNCASVPISTVAFRIEEPMGTAVPMVTDSILPPTWGAKDETCAADSLPGGTCGSGETCFGPPVAQFSFCLSSEPGSSQVACPVASYTKHVFATEFDDTRACGCKCSCPSCTTALFDFTNGCPGQAVGSPMAFNTCIQTTPTSPGDSLLVNVQPKPPTSCTADDTGPTGFVSAGAQVVTVCCP